MAHTVVDHWEPGNGVQELRGRPGRRKVNQGEDNELLGDLKTPYEFNSLSKERERERGCVSTSAHSFPNMRMTGLREREGR